MTMCIFCYHFSMSVMLQFEPGCVKTQVIFQSHRRPSQHLCMTGSFAQSA
jgi:hypothetical protein